jgi:hypothetical protein
MAVGPQFTSCVQPADYEPLNVTPQVIALIAGALVSGPVGLITGGAAVMSAFERVLEYMLNGKLVCLGGERCAIGVVAGFETVSQKPFPDDIDNDWSINLILSPDSADSFIVIPFPTDPDPVTVIKRNALKSAQGGPQGGLVKEQPGMPEPREPVSGWGHYGGYFQEPAGGGWDYQPVLHLECEGSRIHDVLKTLEDISSLGTGGGLCSIPFIGPIACAIVAAVLSPIIAVALTIAWFAADEGSAADAMDPGAPALRKGDLIVATGRWSYDAGHGGYNELHAVRSIQIVDNAVDWLHPRGSGPWGTDFQAYRDRWCGLIAMVPIRQADGAPPVPATPEQQETADRQVLPENSWELHPAVDGCRPREAPKGPAIR